MKVLDLREDEGVGRCAGSGIEEGGSCFGDTSVSEL